jgi:hypothetical protein
MSISVAHTVSCLCYCYIQHTDRPVHPAALTDIQYGIKSVFDHMPSPETSTHTPGLPDEEKKKRRNRKELGHL